MSDRSDFWKKINKFRTCMVTSEDGDKLHSRPMAPHIDEDAGKIRFLTEAGSPKTREIREDHDVNLAFADEGSMLFISVAGRASISKDRAVIKELWNSYADAWFDGDAETANVEVITVVPEEAQFWDRSGSTLVQLYELAKSKLTDSKPNMGDNRKLAL
ncbi:MAG: pyridoxamine 5'-phosphate oxidase family protein [Rhizobiaceae bacterium]|nr:pyridoxamine 5'-phosphate oxidase family protein [Rhizobiaceae bacterium]MCV0408794.1 pyridoxamine 5'-phosphate oxidase family protein [Rhizobiaceae bacterium]